MPSSFTKKKREMLRSPRMLVAFIGAILLLLSASASRAQVTVLPGWDLLTTHEGTSFNGVPFVGVPLNTFDFGGSIGVRQVWDTDTIVQRLETASVPGPVPPSDTDTINIEMVALQLMSAVPTDFGAGVGQYFITLQSNNGGPASTGQMTISFDTQNPNQGTFTSFFDVFFDVRFQAIDGPIVLSDHKLIGSELVRWQNQANQAALLLAGVNHNLNGTDNQQDFHPVGSVIPTGSNVNVFIENGQIVVHVVGGSSVAPEPGTACLLIMGVGLLAMRRMRRRE